MMVLVTGGEGQLGRCIADVVKYFDNENKYGFLPRELFDLTNKEQMAEQFERFKPDVVINCAAYTNVDGAEEHSIDAIGVNYYGVEDLVKLCEDHGTYLIQISTDYVFNGKSSKPYKEDIPTKGPLNVYGMTKLAADRVVLSYNKGIVLRTSWLYSEYGHNFYRTMIDRIRSCKETSVVNDQIGTPTYAKDLAVFIVRELLATNKYKEVNGLYNFSNTGIASWYDFASTIETFYKNFGPYEPIRDKDGTWAVNIEIPTFSKKYIIPTTSKKYKTKAKRPSYSVLDKTKVETEFGIKIPHWTDSLLECMRMDGKIRKTH